MFSIGAAALSVLFALYAALIPRNTPSTMQRMINFFATFFSFSDKFIIVSFCSG